MAVTFGTPVEVDYNGGGTSLALVMSGVASGQPIVVYYTVLSTTVMPTGISDSFSGAYTWTQVDSLTSATVGLRTYIGTGGSGTSGTITITYASANAGAVAWPCIGASTAAGLSAIDVHTITSSTGFGVSSVSLTPGASGEGAVYGVVSQTKLVGPTPPNSPWVTKPIKYSGSNQYGESDSYASPASGSALTTSWSGTGTGVYVTAGLIVLAGVSAPTSGFLGFM